MPRSTQLSCGTCWLVLLDGPVRQDWLATLRRAGLEPLACMARQSLVCRSRWDVTAHLALSLPFVDWLGPHPATAKLAPELVGAQGSRELVLALWPGADAAPVAQSILALGGSLAEVTTRTITFHLPAELTPRVAALEQVAWIQERGRAEPFNSEARWVVQVGWQAHSPDPVTGHRIWQHGLRGQNMIVGLFDSGINSNHDMFVDPLLPLTGPGVFPMHRKIAAYKLYKTADFGDAQGVSFHGSAVAGTLCGNDSVAGDFSKLDGMAPDARTYFVDVANSYGIYVFDDDLTELLDSVRLSTGMSEPVTQVSGSFGSGMDLGYYRIEEASLDAICWLDKNFFVLWAAGNFGPGTYNLGHPSCAKNALTVGSCGNGTASNAVSQFSGYGPTRDNRIKPNLLAPGDNIATVYGGDPHGYTHTAGTSFSAPAASGALVLLRQYFNEGRYPTGLPDSSRRIAGLSSAFMRAFAVTASDTNVGTDYMPNRAAGWGRLDLSSILHFPDDSVAFTFVDDTSGLETGEHRDFEFRLATRWPLRVTLAWTDTAAAPAAAIALVNDLDLELISPDNNHYHGNQFYQGQSTGNPSDWDELNVEEVCRLDYPITGRWTARIRGRSVFTSRQTYALVVKGGIEGMVPGVEECRPNAARGPQTPVSIVRGILHLPEATSQKPQASSWLLDISGRKVMDLKPGPNDVRQLASGVYFYLLSGGSGPDVSGKLVVGR